MNQAGNPVDLDGSHRLATRHQRRLLALRDGGCIFPGCDTPVAWTDAHHITWYEHQGPTVIANLCLLCRHHHHIIHGPGWTLTPNPDHTYTITSPTGHTQPSQRHHGHPPRTPTE